MPILGRWRLGHRFNLVFLGAILLGALVLTVEAKLQDARDPEYKKAVERAHRDSERAVELAKSPTGIPDGGAALLLRRDPLTQGPRLFAQHCAGCHRFGGQDGLGNTPQDTASAPDLKGFGSREWLAGILDPEKVATSHYFGGTKFKDGKMVRFVQQKVAKYSERKRADLAKVILAVSAEAALPAQAELDLRDQTLIEEGRVLARDSVNCTDCHQFRKADEDATAPDLTGWGSREWLVAIISNPAHTRFYGKRNDRMPAFAESGQLDLEKIGTLADWLRGDWVRANAH